MLNTTRAKELFAKEDTFATSLVAICLDTFGIDCFDWDPQTLVEEVHTNFNSVKQTNIDKLLALIVALTTDQFYTDPIVFAHTVDAMNDRVSNWASMPTDLDPDEIAWSAAEVGLNDLPQPNNPVPSFSDDVAGLVGYYLRLAGFTKAPRFLTFAHLEDKTHTLDPETVQAQTERQQKLEDQVVRSVRQKIAMLNAELNYLSGSTSSSMQSEQHRDYMKELLALAQAKAP